MRQKLLGVTALGLMALVMAACQPTQPDLPTMAVLPTDVPTNTPLPTDTPTETNTPAPTLTATPSVTKTPTATATDTDIPVPTRRPSRTPWPTPSLTPDFTDTPNANTVRILTATAAIVEAPTLATLTPIPAGATVEARPTSTGTPLVTADVIITEQQFQDQLELLLAENNAVDSIQVDFKTDGIYITMTASGGAAFSSGIVLFGLQIVEPQAFNRALIMTIDNIEMQGGGEVPQAFMDVATNELYVAQYEALDAILDKRLGRDDHDLENVTLTENSMDVFLYVPR